MQPLLDWFFDIGVTSALYAWRPIVIWTLVALPLYLVLHLWRNASPQVQYHTHLALLFALPLSFVLMPLVPASAPATVAVVGETLVPAPVPPNTALSLVELPLADVGASDVSGSEPLRTTVAVTTTPTWTITHTLGVLSLIALAASLVLLVRAAYLAWGLQRFAQQLATVDQPEVLILLQSMQKAAGVTKPIRLCVTPDASTPMTFGWHTPVIVVPETLLSDTEALRVTLAHEIVHIRRHDYAVGWAVRVVTACFAIHPLVWLLRCRIEQYREISCDAETLLAEPIGTRHYAELLLRFSPLTDLAGPTPLRIVTLDSTLKRRIQAMKQFARFATPQALRLHRRSFVIATSLLIGLATLTACTIRSTENGTIVVSPSEQEVGTLTPLVEEERELPLDADVLEEMHQVLRDRQAQAEAKLYVELQELERREADREMEFQAREQELYQKLRAQELALQDRMLAQQQAQVELLAQHTGHQGHAAEVKRLQLKVDYLEKEMRSLTDRQGALEEKWHSTSGSSKALVRREHTLIGHRLELLQAMYMQHLEALETVKMEAYVQEQLEPEVAVGSALQRIGGALGALRHLDKARFDGVPSVRLQGNVRFPSQGEDVTFEVAIPTTAHVSLRVYDRMGEEIAEVVDGTLEAGEHLFEMSTRDLAKGDYVFRLKADEYTKSGKLTVQ